MGRQCAGSRNGLLHSPVKAVRPEYALLFRDQIIGTGIAHSESVTFHIIIDAFQTTAVHYV